MVRAKAGKKQSAKDATGKAANSAGASLRRHNELALKKVLNYGYICKTFLHVLIKRVDFVSAVSFLLAIRNSLESTLKSSFDPCH